MKAGGLVYGAFVVCAMIWGSTFLAIRTGNDTFPALWACGLRLVLASIVLNLGLLIARESWPKGDALKAAFWYGFYEFGVSLPLLYWGEKAITSGMAAVLYALCPITTMFGAKALGMEEWSLPRFGAATLALCGVATIFWRQVEAGGSLVGMVAVAVAACAASMAALMLQRGPQQSAIGVNAVGAVIACPISFFASFLLGESHPVPSTVGQAFPILYLALASSVCAFVLFAWLVGRMNASTVSFLGVVIPVIAVGSGSLVRHESFPPGAWAGVAIVAVGVVIAIRLPPKTLQSQN